MPHEDDKEQYSPGSILPYDNGGKIPSGIAPIPVNPNEQISSMAECVRQQYGGTQTPLNDSFYKPEWVMCGVKLSNGHARLIASKNLPMAELRYDTSFDSIDIYSVSAHLTRSELTLKCWLSLRGDTVIIDAPTYQEAFQALFKKWNPESDQKALPFRGIGG